MKMQLLKKADGIVVPLSTPLTNELSVDSEGLAKLLDHVITHGVHGVFILGSRGEFIALPDQTREELIKLTVKEVNHRVPVMVNVSGAGIAEVINNVRMAEKHGADAVVLCPPYYWCTLSHRDLWYYYTEIEKQIGLPMFLYNVPQCTSIKFNLELIQRLSEKGKIIGLKESSGDFVFFQDVVNAFRGADFSILQGHDLLLAGSLGIGADGGVPALANIVPKVCVNVYDLVKAGKLPEALELQRQLNALAGIYQYGGAYRSFKYVLRLMGFGLEHIAGPFAPLTQPEKETIKNILIQNQIIAG